MFLYRSKDSKNYSRQCHKMSHLDLEHVCSECSKESNNVEIMELFSSPSFRKNCSSRINDRSYIPENCFILFSYGLVHCGTPSWFINRGEYEKKHKSIFYNFWKSFFLINEITVQKKNLFCKSESCNLYIDNKYATNEENGRFIDLRNSKKSNAKINDTSIIINKFIVILMLSNQKINW